MKKCSKCNKLKPLNEYNKDSQKSDNLTSRCKECLNLNYNPDIKKKYYQENKEKIKLQRNLYRINNLDKQKIYNLSKKEENNLYMKEYNRERRKVDIIFKLKNNTRNLITDTFRRVCKGKFNKSEKTEIILGCTLEEFIKHLQSLFTEGMTLENHGEWEIDHIIPISSAKTEEDIIKLNHYTNLQPLWKEDNRKKSNKFSYEK